MTKKQRIAAIKAAWNHKIDDTNAAIALWDAVADNYRKEPTPKVEDDSFLQLLKREGMLCGGGVLDVGCGAGKMTLALAPYFSELIGVDLSPQMISAANERTQLKQVHHARFYCLNWQELDLARMGWEKRFSLVFAHMSPAVNNAESFLKLCAASNKFCAMAKPTRRVDPVSDAIAKMLGLPVKRDTADPDICHAFNLLFLLGYNPHFFYEPLVWEKSRPFDTARTVYLNRMKTCRSITLAEEAAVTDYLHSIEQDGQILETVTLTKTTLFWRVDERNDENG